FRRVLFRSRRWSYAPCGHLRQSGAGWPEHAPAQVLVAETADSSHTWRAPTPNPRAEADQRQPDDRQNRPDDRPHRLAAHTASLEDVQPLQRPHRAHQHRKHTEDQPDPSHRNTPLFLPEKHIPLCCSTVRVTTFIFGTEPYVRSIA